MPNSEVERRKTVFRDANHLLEFSISHEPYRIYKYVKDFPFESRAIKLTDRLHGEFEEKYGRNTADLVLLYGYGDTAEMLSYAMRHHPEVDYEMALKIVHDPRSINAFARIARNHTDRFDAIRRNGEYYLSMLGTSDVFFDTAVDPQRFAGCPAVRVEGEIVKPIPIFERFVPWAGEIAVQSYFEFKESHSQS